MEKEIKLVEKHQRKQNWKNQMSKLKNLFKKKD